MVWLTFGAAGKAVTFFALFTLKAAPAQTETSTKLHNQLNRLLPPANPSVRPQVILCTQKSPCFSKHVNLSLSLLQIKA